MTRGRHRREDIPNGSLIRWPLTLAAAVGAGAFAPAYPSPLVVRLLGAGVGAAICLAAVLLLGGWLKFRARHAAARACTRGWAVLAGAVGAAVGAGVGIRPPWWLAAGAAAALLYAIVTIWTEVAATRLKVAHGSKPPPLSPRWLALIVGVECGVSMGNAQYLWGPVGNELLLRLSRDEQWLPTGLVPIAAITSGLLPAAIAVVRRWDARNTAWLFGLLGSLALAVTAQLMPVITPAALLVVVVAAGAAVVGSCAVGLAVLAPYALSCLKTMEPAQRDDTNSMLFEVLGFTVCLLFIAQQFLVSPARLGMAGACWASAGLAFALLPALRMLRPDRRNPDMTTVRKALAQTFTLAFSPRRHPHELLAVIMMSLSGAQLRLFYGSAGLILLHWEQPGSFNFWISVASLCAVGLMRLIRIKLLQRLMGGLVRIMVAMLLSITAFLVAWLSGFTSGWVIVAAGLLLEAASTLVTGGLLVLLLNPNAPEAGHALCLGGKNMFGGALSLAAPALFAWWRDPDLIWVLEIVLGLGIVACIVGARRLGAHPGASRSVTAADPQLIGT